MHENIKREIRLSFSQMFFCHNDLSDYIEGMLFVLKYSKVITFSTYYRYFDLLDKYRYSNKMFSFRGAR